MGNSLMITKVFFTHTTDDGYIFDARPMPEESIGTHDKPSTGTPIRLFVIDTNEERKFNTIPGQSGIFLSDEGEKGYVVFYDYQVEDDGNITSQAMYVHPFHRNKGIARKVLFYIESICEEGTISNDHIVADPHLHKIVDELIARGKGTILMRKPTKQ
jgi:GNAT superfamily N-acetyltransferase